MNLPQFIAETNYGPFAAPVSYAAAIVAAIGAITLTWSGGDKDWTPPDEDLPKIAHRIVGLLSCCVMVAIYFFVNAENAKWFLLGGFFSAGITLFAFLAYSQALHRHRYSTRTTEQGNTVKKYLLGGISPHPHVDTALKEKDLTLQDYLTEVAHNDPDRVWTRESRIPIKRKVTLLFVTTLFSGTAAVASLAFVVGTREKPLIDVESTRKMPVPAPTPNVVKLPLTNLPTVVIAEKVGAGAYPNREARSLINRSGGITITTSET